MAATAFLTLRARLARALFDLADHLGEDQVAGVSSSATRSTSVTWRRWRGWRAKRKPGVERLEPTQDRDALEALLLSQ